jgi:hypothetical protein
VAAPNYIGIHIYEDRGSRKRIFVRMESPSSEHKDERGTPYWKGGQMMEIETTGPGDAVHIVAAVKEALQRFPHQ